MDACRLWKAMAHGRRQGGTGVRSPYVETESAECVHFELQAKNKLCYKGRAEDTSYEFYIT